MTSLPKLIPDVDYLLSLEAEELAAFLLVALGRTTSDQSRGPSQLHKQPHECAPKPSILLRPPTRRDRIGNYRGLELARGARVTYTGAWDKRQPRMANVQPPRQQNESARGYFAICAIQTNSERSATPTDRPRLRQGALENRERELQHPQKQRLSSRT
jgi:hypothetical protein